MIISLLLLLLLSICILIVPGLKLLNRVLLILFEMFFFIGIRNFYFTLGPLFSLISFGNILFLAKISGVKLTRRRLIFLTLFEFILLVIDNGMIGHGILISLGNILLIIFTFISLIIKNLINNKKGSLRLSTTDPQQFGESELISFIDKIKEGDFPKASISKSSIDGDYVIVRDLNGVVLSQIKISEISR